MSSPPDDRLALVVVNYGSHELLRRYLAWTFGARACVGFDVVVVDNFRSATDRAAVAQLAGEAGWTLVALDVNRGFGDGVNAGAAKAWELGATAILVVNPDLEFDAADVERLHAALVESPDSIVAPLIVDRDARPWSRLGRVDIARARLTLTEHGEGPLWLTGACIAVTRSLWESAGGMDPDYFMYWEDVDFCVRVAESGGRLRVVDRVTVVHDVGATQGANTHKSRDYYYYNCRNRLVFAAKHLRPREMLMWILLTPGDVRRVVSRGTFPSRAAKWRFALPPAIRGCAAGLGWIGASVVKKRRIEK
jgi:GT2 family glycosyltransferase